MKEMRTLWVLDRFKGVFGKFGVDYPVMRRILQIKLTMDGRRVPTIIGKARNKDQADRGKINGTEKNQFFSSLWLYLIFGAFSSMFVGLGDNFIFQMSLIFGIFMFMIMTSLISDFSSVLLDIRDRNILSTKPVNRRTIAMAKMLHICFYMFFLTGAIAIVPLGVGLVRHGIGFFLLFVAELILMDLLIVVITALIYLAVLKFFDGEKLKDFINYVQIGLTIVIALGYQLLIRLFDFVDLQQAVFQPKWWQFVIVPVWFGAPFETLLHGDNSISYLLFSLLALCVPILTFLLYIKLMPSLERNLQKLADPGSRKKEGAGKWLKSISHLLGSSPQEEVFFRFAWTMMGNEREFKLKVYPSIGFSLIFPFIFLFTSGRERGLSGLPGTKLHLFIYFCALLVPNVILMLKYSRSYKAAWIYRVLPIGDRVPVYRGTLMAAVVRLILPLYAVEAVVFVILFGAEIVPDLIVAGLAILAYSVLSFAYLSKALPFSERLETAQQGEGMRMIPLMLLLGGFALVHYAATLVSFGVYVYAALLLAANWVLWQRAFSVKLP
ncbi:hypothetical protein KB559_16145 [Paenibacillus sp. Marseille-P2973]|uniref:hypothetical protein n=1 Tax=Paenibacillus sp. Marseille-P2973 TaxID=1871032 RepID=UPI001B364924|nr:hypothetical protein [Paenibacillus sp. Marseille-P2973]MBQ4900369.1 hypothetical protein [Paenibacillus sp. Marseille-P2973]